MTQSSFRGTARRRRLATKKPSTPGCKNEAAKAQIDSADLRLLFWPSAHGHQALTIHSHCGLRDAQPKAGNSVLKKLSDKGDCGSETRAAIAQVWRHQLTRDSKMSWRRRAASAT